MGPVAVVVVVQPARAVRRAWLLVYGWACWPTTTIRSCTTATIAKTLGVSQASIYRHLNEDSV